MSEVAPVNIGAVTWPEPTLAYFAVPKMQIKLHHWAAADASRRFGDLFNLVYDPAFLMHAWERRFCDKGWRFAYNGAVFTGASSVAVTRYRYRGNKIATPWTPKPATETDG